VDILLLTNFGQVVNDYSAGNPTAFGQPKVDALGRLATEALSLVVNSETSGAFQLAAGELGNEYSGLYNLTEGTFRVADALSSNGARTLAAGFSTSANASLLGDTITTGCLLSLSTATIGTGNEFSIANLIFSTVVLLP
jgi:hypothetical protein